LIFSSNLTASLLDQSDYWLEASGYRLLADSSYVPEYSEISLMNQLKNGNLKALTPLLNILVTSGRIEEAEIWMEGRGEILPVTRRDLAIALAWYGRFDLYNILSLDLPIPPDLQNDDYGSTIAAVLYMEWMNPSQDGSFYSSLLIGPADLRQISDEFFQSAFHWEKDWIGMRSLDSLFADGAAERENQ